MEKPPEFIEIDRESIGFQAGNKSKKEGNNWREFVTRARANVTKFKRFRDKD